VKINDLQDGQIVRARWGRAGSEEPDFGPWQDVALSVQRLPMTPASSRPRLDGMKPGDVIIVTLRDTNWADGHPRDFAMAPGGGIFTVEDYQLQIQGLER
jgi:hypothetical protein